MAAGIVGIVLGVILGLAVYVYGSKCFMFIAQKTDTKYPWLAWIPLANFFLLAMIARKPWWWALIMVLALVAAWGVEGSALVLRALDFTQGLRAEVFVGWALEIVELVFFVLIWIGICRARNRPGWWVILLIIPIVNFVFLGVLAFSKK